ncbi:transcription factor 15-like protein [Lates japonicus]|uniref:Transcription factor 15-like protein n=1 Tax=Lates japonicus TaxID=270547 RepID=A0AAD3MYP5_LATJO|nr:transcription factor 15-like protein [Lates japonicus]
MMAFTMLRPVWTHPFSYPPHLSLMLDDEEGNRTESDGSTDQDYSYCGTPGELSAGVWWWCISGTPLIPERDTGPRMSTQPSRRCGHVPPRNQ